MKTITPLTLEIILHYYAHARDYREGDFSAPAVREVVDCLISEGMLDNDADPEHPSRFRITEKGRFYIDFLRAVPFPVMRYTIKMEGHHELAAR